MSTSVISCHECRSHLIAYLHDELPARSRRQVAQHLNRCANCYAHYLEQRNLAHDLSFTLRLVGQPSTPQIKRIWSSIQQDMNRPYPVMRYDLRLGFAVALLMLTLLLPWSLGKHQIALALPPNDAPETTAVTPVGAVVMVSEQPGLHVTDAAIPPAETPTAPQSISALR